MTPVPSDDRPTEFVATYTGYRVFMRLLESRWLLPLAQNQPELYESIIRLVRNPLRLLQLTLAVHIGLRSFALPEAVTRFASGLLLALITATVAFVRVKLVDVFVAFLRPRIAESESGLDAQVLPVLSRTLKVIILVIVAVLILQNSGYNISGHLAGLGLGGLAVALALQPTLANMFAALTLFVDRPFRVGDGVNVAGVAGSTGLPARHFVRPLVSPAKALTTQIITETPINTDRNHQGSTLSARIG